MMKKNVLFPLAMLLFFTSLMLPAQAEQNQAQDSSVIVAGSMQPGVFIIYAQSQKYELTLKHKKIWPDQMTELTLYIADYLTNRPVDSVEIKISAQEDPSLVFEFEGHEPGVYHLTGKFPTAQPYSLMVNLNSPSHGPDLLLLNKVEVGKEPPQAEEPASEDVPSQPASDWWKFILVFIGGIGIGYLFLHRKTKVAVVVLIMISLPTIFQEAEAHGGHDDKKTSTAGNSVFIPKETQFIFSILTQEVALGDFQPSVELFGTVVPSPGGFANITTSQSGKIQSLKVTPGQKIKAGQVVAIVIPSASQSDQVGVVTETGRLRAEIRIAQAELTAAEKELTRLRAIADIAAKKDVQAAEARYNAAKANLDALQGISSSTVTSATGSITLKAPVSGTVGQFSLASGAEVIAGITLFTITNLDKVFIEAQVYDHDADIVRNASKYTITFTNDQHRTAAVRFVSAALEVNPSNQSQKVLLEVLNPGGEFKIGEFVTLHAFQQKSDKTIFVPNSALSEINGQPVIFMKDSPEMYSVSYVTLGEDNGTHTVILKGIEDDERYVTDGTYQVKMMMQNQ